MLFRLPLLSLFALFFASCANDIPVVSKERAMSGPTYRDSGPSSPSGNARLTKRGTYSTATPSPAVVQAGQSKPKDKHGMPLYGSSERVRHVRATAYTCTEADHLEYGSMNASGTRLKYSNRVRSAAADWSVYPVGTVFKIKGMPQLFVIDDYGSALTGTGTIDLYKPSHGHMREWGLRKIEITVVQWGSYERSANLLAGRTGYSHCRRMYVAIQRKLGADSSTAGR